MGLGVMLGVNRRLKSPPHNLRKPLDWVKHKIRNFYF